MLFKTKKNFSILFSAFIFLVFSGKSNATFPSSEGPEDSFMSAVWQNYGEALLYSPLTPIEEELLKEKKIRKTVSKTTNLFSLIENGRLEDIAFSLKKVACLDERDSNGLTPLLFSIKLGRDDVFDVLVRSGANIYFSNNRKHMMPLHCAAYFGRIHVLKYFIERYNDIDIPTTDGFSPLMYAIRFAGEEAVDHLVAAGANVNVRSYFNLYSPLHYAAVFGNITIIEKLLIAGADLYAQDSSGNSAFHWAALNKNKNNFYFLKNYYGGFLPMNDKMQSPLDLCNQEHCFEK